MTADLMLTKRAKNAIGELRTALLFVTLLSPCAHPRIEALFVSRESMWNRKSVLMESTPVTGVYRGFLGPVAKKNSLYFWHLV